MTDYQVEAIVDELHQEQTKLRDRLTELKTELAKIEVALTRVNGALNALKGTGKGKSMRRPAATKQDVIAEIALVLRDREKLTRGALKQIVEQRIIATGKSRMGYALRFKEALAEPQFIATPEGIALDEGLPPERLSA